MGGLKSSNLSLNNPNLVSPEPKANCMRQSVCIVTTLGTWMLSAKSNMSPELMYFLC